MFAEVNPFAASEVIGTLEAKFGFATPSVAAVKAISAGGGATPTPIVG